MLPPPPPRREARNELKPTAAFRIPASRVKLRHLRAAAIGHLRADKTVPRADRDRDRPARSAAPSPAHHRGRQAVCTGMHARLSGSRQAGTRCQRGPSVAVRGKPTVHTDRPGGRTPSLYVRGHRDTAVYSDTR